MDRMLCAGIIYHINIMNLFKQMKHGQVKWWLDLHQQLNRT